MGEVSPLNEMYRNYRDKGFEFFTIYVREPHPGEKYGPHKDFAQKLEFARQCRDQDGIENPLLVDDLEGTVHRLYGVLPNMVYIVSKEGRIVYKAMWTDHDEIRVVLDNLVMADELRAEGVRLKPSLTEKINFIPAQYAGGVREKVFDRAGPKAWEDYRSTFGG